MRRAIQVAVFVATLAAASVLASLAGRDVFTAASRIRAPAWLAIGAAMVAWLALEWLRFGSLLAILGFRLRARLAVQLTCASYFVSTLTPTAELTVPTMAWMLQREGLSAPRAAAASLVKSLYMTLWVCAIGFGSLVLLGGAGLPPSTARKVMLASIWLVVPVTCFAALLAFPHRVQAWAARRRGPGWRGKLADGFAHAADAISSLGRSTSPLHLACHAGSIGSILVYVVIGRIVAAALGIDLSWARALTVFSNGLIVAYLAPVPGSIGVTELATAYLIDPALPADALAAAIVLRCLCWYGPAAAGALVLWRWAWRPVSAA